MQSRVHTITGLICLSLLFCFCKKETSSIEESPFFDYFNESSIIIDTIEQAADSWEYGFTFEPLTTGKITQLGIKLPATGDFTASLWDLNGVSPLLLRTKTVNAAAAHANTFEEIPELVLRKNDKFGITVRSDAFYRMRKSCNEAFSFPKTIGNINILSFNQAINNSGDPVFPLIANDTIIAPCVNVIFIAD